MAKTVKPPSITLAKLEKLYGPVLPGEDRTGNTISVFRDFASKKAYALFGKPGILPGAIWYLHTVLDMQTVEESMRISGIIEEGPQHDSGRRELVENWRQANLAAANNPKKPGKRKATSSQTDTISEKPARLSGKGKKTAKASIKEQKPEPNIAGTYEAELKIPELNALISVKVKISAKGKVTLIPPATVV